MIREQEILGVAGVAGNGQQELCETLVGLRKVESGAIRVNNEELTNSIPKTFIDKGIHYIPADRKGTGLVPNMNVSENSILKRYWSRAVSKKGFIDWKEVFSFARGLVSRYNVSTPSMETPVRNLSGGNLQKLMLGRELSDSPIAILAVHPTWGLDVAATKFVREQLLAAREAGCAFCWFRGSRRTPFHERPPLVMCKGEIMGILGSACGDACESIGLMMAGTPAEEALASAPRGGEKS